MLWAAARVRSAADLDDAGRQAVLDHLKARGFKPAPRGSSRRHKAPPLARLIYHIWNRLADHQVVESRDGLKTWLRNQTQAKHPDLVGWERPEFLPREVAQAVAEQLKQWATRTGVDWQKRK